MIWWIQTLLSIGWQTIMFCTAITLLFAAGRLLIFVVSLKNVLTPPPGKPLVTVVKINKWLLQKMKDSRPLIQASAAMGMGMLHQIIVYKTLAQGEKDLWQLKNPKPKSVPTAIRSSVKAKPSVPSADGNLKR